MQLIDKQKIEYFLTKKLVDASRSVKTLPKKSNERIDKVTEMNLYKDVLDHIAAGAFDYEYDGLEQAINNFDNYIDGYGD